MYRKMRLLDLIADDADRYVDLAVRLGTDRDYAAAMSARISDRNHVLYEDARVVREFERFFMDALGQRVAVDA
jgi:predicted O-linked N-acetylglucosamine transferase (SPINDLY family)